MCFAALLYAGVAFDTSLTQASPSSLLHVLRSIRNERNPRDVPVPSAGGAHKEATADVNIRGSVKRHALGKLVGDADAMEPLDDAVTRAIMEEESMPSMSASFVQVSGVKLSRKAWHAAHDEL